MSGSNRPGGRPGSGKQGNQTGEHGQYINGLTAKVLNVNATLAYICLLLLAVQVYNIPEEELYLKFLPTPGAFLFGATVMWLVQLIFIKLAAGKTD